MALSIRPRDPTASFLLYLSIRLMTTPSINKITSNFLVAMAAGIFAGTVVIEIAPDVAKDKGWLFAIAWIAFGFGVWWVLKRATNYFTHVHSLAIITTLAFWLHSSLEGTATALSFSAGAAVGLAVAFGMALHLLPEFLALLGLMKGEGVSFNKTAMVQLISILLLGVSFVVVYRFVHTASQTALPQLEALSGGAFLFIAITSFWKRRGQSAVFGVLIGLAAIIIWRLLLG